LPNASLRPLILLHLIPQKCPQIRYFKIPFRFPEIPPDGIGERQVRTDNEKKFFGKLVRVLFCIYNTMDFPAANCNKSSKRQEFDW
jgi:hypothetical protein